MAYNVVELTHIRWHTMWYYLLHLIDWGSQTKCSLNIICRRPAVNDIKVWNIIKNIPWLCAYKIIVTYPINVVLMFGQWLLKPFSSLLTHLLLTFSQVTLLKHRHLLVSLVSATAKNRSHIGQVGHVVLLPCSRSSGKCKSATSQWLHLPT